MYPGWVPRFYIDGTVEPLVANQLRHTGAEVILVNSSEFNFTGAGKMMWRFFAVDEPNVGLVLSRDVDSRVTIRTNQGAIAAKPAQVHVFACFLGLILRFLVEFWGK